MSIRTREGFTLIELLAVLAVIVLLSVLTVAAVGRLQSTAQRAYCANNLRQLGVATQLYLADHSQAFFPYVTGTAEGRLWYFGLETSDKSRRGEGNRELDSKRSPLYPYVQQTGGIEICPAFPYENALWKNKFKGASWGYGYNWRLGGQFGGNPMRITELEKPSRVVVFGDCAQVNTFQAPASPSNPMIEEFYIINETFKTVHFRHGNVANFVFADGHVESLPPEPGTIDQRLPEANVGRITPAGSTQYLY